MPRSTFGDFFSGGCGVVLGIFAGSVVILAGTFFCCFGGFGGLASLGKAAKEAEETERPQRSDARQTWPATGAASKNPPAKAPQDDDAESSVVPEPEPAPPPARPRPPAPSAADVEAEKAAAEKAEAVKREKAAGIKFGLAKQLLADGRKDAAVGRLRKIVADYPGTEAAKDAVFLLEKTGR